MPDDRGQFDLHNESFASLTVIYVEGSVPAAAQQIPSLSVLQFQMSKGAVTLPLSKQYFTVNLDHKQKNL